MHEDIRTWLTVAAITLTLGSAGLLHDWWVIKQTWAELDANYIHNFTRDLPAGTARMKCEAPMFQGAGDYCMPRAAMPYAPNW